MGPRRKGQLRRECEIAAYAASGLFAADPFCGPDRESSALCLVSLGRQAPVFKGVYLCHRILYTVSYPFILWRYL
jgi:hypothetical protein